MVDKSQEQATKIVMSYLDKAINGYLVHDIYTLLNEKLDEKEQGGCTAPLAMAVLSGMNQLGYLIHKKIINKKETETYIKAFCDNWMAKADKIYKKTTIQEMLVNVVRHGMAHQFLSIYPTGITRDPKQKGLVHLHKNESGQKIYVFQIKMLAKHFLKAVQLLNDKISGAIENDPDFIMQFYKKLVLQKDKYSKKNFSLFNKAERNIEVCLFKGSTNKTTPSGVKINTTQTTQSTETTQTIDRSLELLD